MRKCNECKNPLTLLYSAGQLVCRECGLVIREKCFFPSRKFIKMDNLGSYIDYKDLERKKVSPEIRETIKRLEKNYKEPFHTFKSI